MAKKPALKLLLLLLLLHSAVFAHFRPNDPHINDVNFYMHLMSMYSGVINGSYDLNLYLTMQLPLDEMGNYHVIINPAILDRSDYFKLGSGIGIRRSIPYEHNPDACYYLQLMPSVHYFKRSVLDADNNYETISGQVTSVLGYIGMWFGVSFIDVGAGYSWNFAEKNHGLAFDINFGTVLNFLTFPLIILVLPFYVIF
jgi:hypothetical protein